jgi:hypothetical protein
MAALTWKDGIATLLVAATAGITYARAKGMELPLLASWRMAALALLVLGMTACAVGAGNAIVAGGPWNTIASALGILALILGVLGIITGQKIIVITLAIVIAGLWIATTFRHLLGV